MAAHLYLSWRIQLSLHAGTKNAGLNNPLHPSLNGERACDQRRRARITLVPAIRQDIWYRSTLWMQCLLPRKYQKDEEDLEGSLAEPQGLAHLDYGLPTAVYSPIYSLSILFIPERRKAPSTQCSSYASFKAIPARSGPLNSLMMPNC